MQALSRSLALVLGVVVLFLSASDAFGRLITDPSDSALAGATLIDFEDQTTGTYYQPITIHNVVFTAAVGWTFFNDNTQQWETATPYLSIRQPTPYSENKEIHTEYSLNMVVSFPSPVTAFGFRSSGNNAFRLFSWDSNQQILELYYYPYSGPDSGFLGIAGENIAGFTLAFWTGNDRNWWGVMDNLYYVPAASTVPIPGAVWLLGSGLLGLGAVGWRRKRGR